MNGITAALTGRLGGDAELKYTANGTVMATFSVAVDDAKKAEGEPAEWVRVTVWGEPAEDLAPRLMKGTAVYLEGRLRLETWMTREGEQRSTLKLSAWTCQPMGQLGRQRPRQDAQARRPTARPQAVAVGLDDDLEGWPE
jgi:single-strand DNA-binding protein